MTSLHLSSLRWRLLKGLGAFLLFVVALLLCYSALVAWMYRDIPADELQRQYYPSLVSTVDVDGVSLRYTEQGQGPVLLLLHSHYFSMTMWDDWVEPLAEHFRVVRFDMTSHGLTGADPSGDYTMARSQQLIEGLLSSLQIDRLSIIGSSLGGNMAFTFSARHPERVENLVLINSGGLKHSGNRSGTVPGWADVVLYLLPRYAFEYFLKWMIADDGLVDAELVEAFHNSWRREGNRPAEMNRIRDFVRGDTEGDLGKIAAPVLLMWGRENPQLPYSLVYEFKNFLSKSSRVQVNTYEKVGHVLPLEIPDQGVRDVLRFLQSNTQVQAQAKPSAIGGENQHAGAQL